MVIFNTKQVYNNTFYYANFWDDKCHSLRKIIAMTGLIVIDKAADI